ncbi:hypothetical protein FQN60_014247 [Etheostoma spectabile]|uniref:Fe2OG dioxygenase domain-containing protein n=1 Tax=Etheostoma spectabile TaxID=54343 RepID=A0A5J5DB32_9PERO|nr:hypothetical protein FQN60_014247 [Etheostoma spectabile]
MSIPVVDFGAYSLSEEDVTDDQMQNLSKDLKTAFTEVGFVFLKNTGITQEEVDRVMAISKTFFLQPDEVKQPFSRKSFAHNPNHGWVSLEMEKLNPRRPGDLKEAFNYASLHPDIRWPSIKGFQEIQTSFFQRCTELSLRVLRVMAHSLGLNPEVFLGAHRLIGTDENGTTLRSLYYPPVNHETVRKRSGEFICAPSVPGAALINVADLMQRWTSDQFVSVVHRVLLPPAGDPSTRQSLAFFVQPDDEALITCCDGSNKYPPVTGGDYLTERFNASYGN